MVDPNATPETKALYKNLKRVSNNRVLFGHQHTTCYGINWENDPLRSDVKTMTGSFPAVYGWDMGHSGTKNMDQLIIDAFERGGINTISWHMANLSTGKSCKDVVNGSVKAVLPGGKHHGHLRCKLDAFAEFVLSLRNRDGRLVPIIFRPWHEHTGAWFWWGSTSCTPEEFDVLWRFTITYLRDEKSVHNLIYSLSPDGQFFETEAEYEANRFPEYEFIDILGFDMYGKDDVAVEIAERCAVVSRLAKQYGKMAALTEFGYRDGLNNCTNSDWYMDFLAALKATPDAGGISYFMTWRNASESHFWIPYRGQDNESDFKRFYLDSWTVFEDDLLYIRLQALEP